MSLWKIAWKSIQQRSLASALTGLSMALGVALVAAVLVIHGVLDRSFRRGAQGYDLIVGPKGSPLQLVLSTVYHMGDPVGKMPYDAYRRLLEQRFHLPDGSVVGLKKAVPMALSSDDRGFAVVGTRPEFFDPEMEYQPGQHYEFNRDGGQGRNMDIAGVQEAVVGPTVARKQGIRLGDTFRLRHGSYADQDHLPFTVVGIFAPTGTPNDRAVFVNLEGFFKMHQHGRHHGEASEDEHAGEKPSPSAAAPAGHAAVKGDAADSHADHEEHEEHHEKFISAVLVCLDETRPEVLMAVPRLINDMPGMQAVHPAKEISDLLDGMVGNVQLVLLILAVLVVVVAGISILVSIYNSMNDRRHEIAIMRALGASRLTVMLVILMESILLSLGGGAVGLVLAHGLVGLLGPLISDQTGVVVSALHFQATELFLIPLLIVVASVVGYWPAVVAYRTDVAKALASAP